MSTRIIPGALFCHVEQSMRIGCCRSDAFGMCMECPVNNFAPMDAQ